MGDEDKSDPTEVKDLDTEQDAPEVTLKDPHAPACGAIKAAIEATLPHPVVSECITAVMPEGKFISADLSQGILAFKLQQGPIKEVGLHGCQLTDLVRVAREMLTYLNDKFPCWENKESLICLDEFLRLQDARTARREAAGTEGTNREDG